MKFQTTFNQIPPSCFRRLYRFILLKWCNYDLKNSSWFRRGYRYIVKWWNDDLDVVSEKVEKMDSQFQRFLEGEDSV
jgi:hypothetical protein